MAEDRARNLRTVEGVQGDSENLVGKYHDDARREICGHGGGIRPDPETARRVGRGAARRLRRLSAVAVDEDRSGGLPRGAGGEGAWHEPPPAGEVRDLGVRDVAYRGKGPLAAQPGRGIEIPAQLLLAPTRLSPDQRYVLKNLVERDGAMRSAAIFALGYWAGCRVSDVS